MAKVFFISQDNVRDAWLSAIGQVLYNGDEIKTEYDKLLLCKKLKQLETYTHHRAEDYCNGVIDTEDTFKDGKIKRGIEFYLDRIRIRLNNILKYGEKNIPVFINTDPRGYALKIKDGYVSKLREDGINIHRDFGGYGIIAPDLMDEKC